MSFFLQLSYPMNSSYMFFSFPKDSFSIPFFLSRLSSSFSMYSFSMFFFLSQTCYVLRATCYMLRATCYVLHATRCMLNTTFYLLKTRCHRPTDRQTNSPTNRRTLSCIELLLQLKTHSFISDLNRVVGCIFMTKSKIFLVYGATLKRLKAKRKARAIMV